MNSFLFPSFFIFWFLFWFSSLAGSGHGVYFLFCFKGVLFILVKEDSGLPVWEEQERDVKITLKLFLVKYFGVVLIYPKTCLHLLLAVCCWS
jgi:hypothetical protein